MASGASPADPGASEPGEHPEARGFGSSRRPRWELGLVIGLLMVIPAALLWGARGLAELVALRLPPGLDAHMGMPTWESLKLSGEMCDDRAGGDYVQRVMVPLLDALGPTPFNFQAGVVDAAEVNAFALPGGFLLVNSGLFGEAQNGDEVAAVLAHEISHVTARHSTRRLASKLGTGAALALIFGIVDFGAPAYTLASLADLGYDRDQEREADELGIALLMRAGISPLGLATFFERTGQELHPPELLSTHPDSGDRAQRARQAAEGFQARVTVPPPPALRCSGPEK
jgi:predicted Zn-dependent protease